MHKLSAEELRSLYERFGYAVHRRCRRILGSAAEADDALQEVFLRAYRYGGRSELQSELAWLYTIADRCCFDLLAKKKRQVLETAPEPSFEPDLSGSAAVRHALRACPVELRDIGVLYYVDEMTQDEVAKAVGLSRTNVRLKLERFQNILRRFLRAEES